MSSDPVSSGRHWRSFRSLDLILREELTRISVQVREVIASFSKTTAIGVAPIYVVRYRDG